MPAKVVLPLALAAVFCLSLNAQDDPCKTTVLKHLKTSEDFTVKVAEAMPTSDYDFKLTKPQMSFGEQMVHLASGLSYFTSPFTQMKPGTAKPKSMSKEDIVAFIKQSYEAAIQQVSQLTSEQLSKTYKSEEGTDSGFDLLLGMLDHSTHHRASAEMYLRAKGITPPPYED